MTRRSIQHQLEDFSRHKFHAILPVQWVFRDKDKDYGIDGEVEIFDEKGNATGYVYWVQLKATKSTHESTIKCIDLSLKTINYYKSLDIPVLIVRYSSEQDSFYTKWAHEIDSFYAKTGAKTMRVKFKDSDLWDDTTASTQERYLAKLKAVKSGHISLPIKAKLTFANETICGISIGFLKTQIRDAAEKYTASLQFINDDKNAITQISLSEKILKVRILETTGIVFHSVALMEKSTFPEDITQDIVLGLSAALAQLGYKELAAKMIFSNSLSDRLETKPELVELILPMLVDTSYLEDLLNTAGKIIDKTDNNFLELTALASLIFSTGYQDNRFKIVDRFLQKISDKNKEINPVQYGISLYNQGNFYRSNGKLKKAARYFLLARKNARIYYERDYFFRELASALFDIGKYRFASGFYKKALKLGGKEEWEPLYADALFYSGSFKESLEAFDEYLKKSCDHTAEWHLKKYCLEDLIENYGAEHTRKSKLAASVISKTNLKPPFSEELLEEALSHDILDGLSWYNLGQIYAKNDAKNEACFCFTVCGLSQRWDIEAWVNASLLSFSSELPAEIFVLIVRTAYSCNREKYLGSLFEQIESQLAHAKAAEISLLIEEIIDTENASVSSKEIRLFNQDGTYENILVPDPS